MLQAFLHSKRKIDYLDEANPFVEDTLTSSVFGLLRYLPDKFLNDIWEKALFPCGADDFCLGNLRECVFWPYWELPAGGTWCEPDVFCQFEHGHIIVEAKRNDIESLQLFDQWEKELVAYRHFPGQAGSARLFLLAIGGLGGESASVWQQKSARLTERFSCSFIFSSWAEFWGNCIKPVLRTAVINEGSRAIHTLYHDLQRVFRLFGIETDPPKPMATFIDVAAHSTYQFGEALLPLQGAMGYPASPACPGMDSFPRAIEHLQLSPVTWSFYNE